MLQLLKDINIPPHKLLDINGTRLTFVGYDPMDFLLYAINSSSCLLRFKSLQQVYTEIEQGYYSLS